MRDVIVSRDSAPPPEYMALGTHRVWRVWVVRVARARVATLGRRREKDMVLKGVNEYEILNDAEGK